MKLARGKTEQGIDARTIAVDLECILGRPPAPAEVAAMLEGWRAAAPARHERYRAKQQQAADASRTV